MRVRADQHDAAVLRDRHQPDGDGDHRRDQEQQNDVLGAAVFLLAQKFTDAESKRARNLADILAAQQVAMRGTGEKHPFIR